MKKMMIGLLATISVCTVSMMFDTANHPTYAGSVGCISWEDRDDGGDVGYLIVNHCGRDITFVIYTNNGMDYLAMHANRRVNWTVDGWDRSKACNGWANTDC
jgi:hypothetical protein